MYNISKDTLSRVSARNRNRTSYAEVVEGLDYNFPLQEVILFILVMEIILKEVSSFLK